MRATCKPSSAPGLQMSTSGAVRRGIVARMAEFIEASIIEESGDENTKGKKKKREVGGVEVVV